MKQSKTHIDIVLDKMFSVVGKKRRPKDTEGDRWYMRNTWDEETETEFREWLADYLYKHAQARREIMRFPIKRKKSCEDTARWFCFQYGWTYTKQKKKWHDILLLTCMGLIKRFSKFLKKLTSIIRKTH